MTLLTINIMHMQNTKILIYMVLLSIISCMTTKTVMAQKETEVFIPIGASPGISGEHSIIGKIDSLEFDSLNMKYIVELKGMNMAIQGDSSTVIYIDNSDKKKQSVIGDYSDMKIGQLAEVKFRKPSSLGVAEWIKVRPKQQ